MADVKNRTIDISSVLAQAADVKTEVIEGELLIYHPAHTRAIYLNPQAALIWGLCDGDRSVGDIVRLIEESYPEAKQVAKAQVLAAVDELYANGILVDR